MGWRCENIRGLQVLWDDGEAPGAIPNGQRIVKIIQEEGDGHPVGAGGVVVGSIYDELGGYFYFVHWDDVPDVPIGITAYKIRAAREGVEPKEKGNGSGASSVL